MIDTHCHIDDPQYQDDLPAFLHQQKEGGVEAILVPGVDVYSIDTVLPLCAQYPDYLYPALGLHPEEVKEDYLAVLDKIYAILKDSLSNPTVSPVIAVGEVGLDYYWSREYEKEQLAAFEEQVKWSVETHLPLMIHCRKAQNEMVRLLRNYEKELPGGVFHCFTGNEKEAAELLQFENFVLGIGGVLTFKKSHLPEVLPSTVPLSRIVLETDSPYMAPVPYRGQRNESAFVAEVLAKLADCYGVSRDEVAEHTNRNVHRVFGI